MRNVVLTAGLGLALASAIACGHCPKGASAKPGAQGGAAAPAREGESARLHELFDRGWTLRLRAEPVFATMVGVHDYDDQLPSQTPAALAANSQSLKELLEELEQIDLSQLDDTDRINYAIFRTLLEDDVTEYEFGTYQMPIISEGGFHSGFAQLPTLMPFATVSDYERYLSRLRQWPRAVKEEIALMRLGLERGMTPPQVVLRGVESTIDPYIVDDPKESGFYRPFAEIPASVPAHEHDRLRRAGEEAIAREVVPGFRALRDFVVGEYVPGARTSIGAHALPNGRAYYAYLVKHFTTLDLSAKEIHEIGLREVERIHAEMAKVIEEVGFEGSFAEFLELLRTDPRFYAKTPEELLEEAAFIAKRMDGKLPALFGRLPRLPYTVEPVPDEIASRYTTGRYIAAPAGSTRPGRYWVNTHALETRPLYDLEALTLHEAVPGHHLQTALTQELEELPAFRRYSEITAYGEGWALYAEWLGLEAGFYTDPYRNFGRLGYEMWRACRLVVDTGLHELGWSREQAMEYLASHTALSRHNVQTEIDRYISWPGQALGYKIGELHIKRLRKRAEAALGERFDVREFHDAILADGPVPLRVLEQSIERFIEKRLQSPARQ